VQQVPPVMATEGSPESRFTGVGSQYTLQQFANLTGGPTKSTAGIGDAVRQAMNDVRTSYTIGYFPPLENWDGKFHKLRVTCARKGVRIQAKTGYYAWQDPASDEEQALDDALTSSFDAAEIGMRAAMPQPFVAGRPLRIDFRVDASDVRMNQEGEKYTAHLALQMAAFAADGKPERTKVMPLDLSLSAAERAKAVTDGIAFTQSIALPATVEKLRLAVFDRGAYAIGSLTIPVKPAK